LTLRGEPMIRSYNDCLKDYKSAYQIKKAVGDGRLYKIEPGIYSDKPEVSTLAVISAKYPQAIITMDTAFYYHGLTDVIPDEYSIATPEASRALRDKRIRQYFVKDQIFEIGVTTMERGDAKFRIYDKERMLIEVLRFKNKLPFDYYKEIIGNYRKHIYDLDIERIQEYSSIFPRHKMISEALDREVF
jgi:hypothetical protein